MKTFNKYLTSTNKEFLDFDLDYLITGAADGTVRLWAVQISGGIVVAKLISNIGTV